MNKLFRYGVNRPVLTWLTFVVGIILLILDAGVAFFNPGCVTPGRFAFVANVYFFWLLVILFLVAILSLFGLTLYKYRLTDRLIQHYNLRNTPKILDVSTGTGYFITHVVKAAGYVAFATGIEDPNHNRITRARKNARQIGVNNRINVIHGALQHLPFPAAAFNLVTMLDHHRSLFSRPKSDLYQKVCDEIFRVTKPNGALILISDRHTVARVEQYFSDNDYVKTRLARGVKPKFGWRVLVARKTA